LNFKVKKELEQLPIEIEALEETLTELQQLTSSADFHAGNRDIIQNKMNELTQINQKLQDKYQRWDELDSLS
jgi:ATP-binding cassette subfamily F protein uup